MPQDEVTSLSLKLTEEDIRKDCAAMGIPYTALHAVGRRLRAQNTATQMSDVLYIMLLAKSRGLNPVADNYSLIPRPDGNGFGTTFNKEAALHVINLHPKVKKGSIARRFIVTGKGERIDLNEHPEKAPGGWKLSDIDWDMTAIYEVDAEAGGVLRGFAKYRNCVAVGRDGNPKYLWLKDASGMTMKQAAKDLANTHLDGSLPDEDAIEAAQQAELPSAPATASTQPQLPATAGPSTQGVPSSATTTAIVEKAAKLGYSEGQILGAFAGSGMKIEDFEKGLDEQLAHQQPANGKVQSATPAAEVEKEVEQIAPTEAPKAAEAPASTEKKARQRKPPKPVISVTGEMVGYTVKHKDAKRKDGTAYKQEFLQVELAVGGEGDPTEYYFVWDSKLHQAVKDGNGQIVEIDYVMSGPEDDPAKQFKEVRALEVITQQEEAEVPEANVEEHLAEAEVEDTPGEGPEAPQNAEPTSDGPGPLFNFFET